MLLIGIRKDSFSYQLSVFLTLDMTSCNLTGFEGVIFKIANRGGTFNPVFLFSG